MTAPTPLAAAPTTGSSLWIQWTLTGRGQPTIVSFCGDLGAGGTDVLLDRLRAAVEGCPGRLIVDLTGVGPVDVDGARAVVRARQHAAEHHVCLEVACPPGALGNPPLDLGDEIGLYDSLTEALDAHREANG